MKILVTGGAGYIGSTICSALEDHGHVPVILDSLITGRVEFTRGRSSTRGISRMMRCWRDLPRTPRHHLHHPLRGVDPRPRFGRPPFEYYRENVAKSLQLFQAYTQQGCNGWSLAPRPRSTMTCRVHGHRGRPAQPAQPLRAHEIYDGNDPAGFLRRLRHAGHRLRYFNPIGADPLCAPAPICPTPPTYSANWSRSRRGANRSSISPASMWPTRDGSGIRDYLHVWDLAQAHVQAMEQFAEAFSRAGSGTSYLVINLGTGNGVTVKRASCRPSNRCTAAR